MKKVLSKKLLGYIKEKGIVYEEASYWERVKWLDLRRDIVEEFLDNLIEHIPDGIKVRLYDAKNDSVYGKCVGLPDKDSFLSKFKDILDWDTVIHPLPEKITDNYLREHKDYVNWRSIGIGDKVTEECLEELGEHIMWWKLANDRYLSEEFILRNIDKLDMGEVSKSQCMSLEFIEKIVDKLDLKRLPGNREISLTEDFVRKHKDELDWTSVIVTQGLFLEELVDESREFIDWGLVSEGFVLSERLIYKYFDYLEMDWLSNDQDLSIGFIDKHMEELSFDLLEDNCRLNAESSEYVKGIIELKKKFN